jgi:aldehyde:ferredoxin oxidoreductase
MATPGFAGKILLANLSTKETRALDTEKYEMYGGGHGTSTALFWEFCMAPGDWDLDDAFHPKNMVSLMTGATSGTGVLAGARTSVSGLSPQCYPIQWFSHSNFGGMFSTLLKMAGWDGVAVIGKADSPVYINIIDDKVRWKTPRSCGIWMPGNARKRSGKDPESATARNGLNMMADTLCRDPLSLPRVLPVLLSPIIPV